MILFPKEYRRSAARVFLATLPILYGVKSLPEAFNQALLVAIALWLTNCFFVFCGSFLPRKLFRFSFYLWLATLAQVGYCFMQGDFFWIVSLVLLQPLETFREPLRWRGLQKSLYRGVFFICLMITLGCISCNAPAKKKEAVNLDLIKKVIDQTHTYYPYLLQP